MNKKYLSVILFGALMLGTTGMFTSCKDYDDDITNLQTQVDGIKTDLKALQDKVNAGRYVTNVTKSGDGIVITWNDNTTSTIETIKGDKGDKGDNGTNGTEWTIGEDGYWYKDGTKTEYKAAISEETKKIVVPTIKDGYWYLVDEESGELTATEYKANGAAYAVAEANGGYTLYLPNEAGTEMVEIYIPGAAGSITDMKAELTDNFPSPADDRFTIKSFVFNLTAANRAAWKALTGKDATTNRYILTSADEIRLRINPVNVDASKIKFSLYNSKNEPLPNVTLLPTEFKGYETTRAAYGNGLYTLAMEKTEVKDNDALDKLDGCFQSSSRDILYAVSATPACFAEYNIPVNRSVETANIGNVIVNRISVYPTNTSTVDSKATNTVTVESPSDLYDMWFSVAEEDLNLFDIVFDQENHTFVVNADPDVITKSSFDLTITMIDNSGEYVRTVVTINVSSKIVTDADYDKITHTIVANKTTDDPNFFTAPMSTMTEALGSQLDAWKKNLRSFSVAFYTDAKCKEEVQGAAGIALTFISADGRTPYYNNDIKNATLMKFAVTNTDASRAFQVDKVYYAKVTFSGANGELNSIVIPFEFKIPALSTLFEQKTGYVVDGVINAYFYDTSDSPTTAVELNKYFSKSVDDAAVSLVRDEKINNALTTTLFTFNNTESAFGTATIDLIDGKSNNGVAQKGYGQAVTVNVNKNDYEGWAYKATGANKYSFKIRLMSPIYQGTIVPAAGSTITIAANDLVNGALITDADIKGKDYNNNTYTIVPDKVNGENPAWANPQIKKVTVKPDDDGYIKNVEPVPAKTVDGSTVKGAFKLTGESISNTVPVDMPVTVEDVWGYKKTVQVPVTITKN